MKWFQHWTDSHTNLKHREIFAEYGLEGYAVYWICVELVGQQGTKYCLNSTKNWQKALRNITGISEEKLEKILNKFGELNLICPKSLKKGNLYIPKMSEYSDNYTKSMRRLYADSTQSLRSNYAETTNNVRLDKIRIDKIRIDKTRLDKIRLEYIRIRGFDIKNFSSDDLARTAKAIKTLILKAKNNDDLVIKALCWASQQNWCDWTLETVIKRWADFMKPVITYE